MANFCGQASAEQQLLLEQFIAIYPQLRADNLALLAQIYDDDIRFQDPMHQLQGLTELTDYFAGLYRNITDIHFDIQQVLMTGAQAAITWRMSFAHPQLARGKVIAVDGMSHLTLEHKIIFHRDYFDVGQMLYEQLPLVGGMVRWIKQRAQT